MDNSTSSERTERDRERVFVNLTGHDLELISSNLPYSHTRTIPVEGRARVMSKMTTEYRAHNRGLVIPVLSIEEQEVTGLPAPIASVLYIVSGLVAAHVDRDDVVSPSRVERTRNGRVIGCRALVKLS